MTPAIPKRLRMFAGPNGSGKTSLVWRLAREYSTKGLFQLHHFINADDLFRDLQEGRGVPLDHLGRVVSVEQIRAAFIVGGRLRPDHPFVSTFQVVNSRLMDPGRVSDAYVAASIADYLRDEWLAAGQSFSFETVMSHRSKIDFFARARAAGYRTYLYFIATEFPDLNVSRVRNRAVLGGHDVPQSKIMERYKRCLELVGEGLAQSYRGFLFDNTGVEPVWLAELTPEGKLQLQVEALALPIWFRTWVAPRYPGCIA